jgi:hypothetical protein
MDRFAGVVSVVLIIFAFSSISGCLEKDEDPEPEGVAALSVLFLAEKEKNDYTGDLQLVVVTGMDPTSGGNSLTWKFAYNDVTSGIALRSFLVTIDEDKEVKTEVGDPLSKTPIRNWTVDSITAYARARTKLIDEGIITSSVKITVRFLYLLGEDSDNSGCEWTIGMVLGSEQPVEATVRIDGRFGNVIEIIDSRN